MSSGDVFELEGVTPIRHILFWSPAGGVDRSTGGCRYSTVLANDGYMLQLCGGEALMDHKYTLLSFYMFS